MLEYLSTTNSLTFWEMCFFTLSVNTNKKVKMNLWVHGELHTITNPWQTMEHFPKVSTAQWSWQLWYRNQNQKLCSLAVFGALSYNQKCSTELLGGWSDLLLRNCFSCTLPVKPQSVTFPFLFVYRLN